MAEDGRYEAVKKYLESEGPGKSKADVPKVFGEVEFWWSKEWEVRLAIDQPAMESVTGSGVPTGGYSAGRYLRWALNKFSTKHAVLMYREIMGIEQYC
jgi:hypothetical protein